ncbi:MAG TPA: response regulator [Longimicrobiales bacterium]|jgi:CheY-like chemotaxis protein
MARLKKKIEDWMVRVSFAEVGADQQGFDVTGTELDRKTTLALDRVRVFRSEVPTETREGEDMADQEAGAGDARQGDLSVMVIDDEPIVGKRLKPALEKSGFAVECYEDPAQAVARLGEREFDIVVTDLRMEDVNGIQILEHVMAHCERTRVILITGYATVEVAREALVKGAFDFISKPFKPNDLRAVVNKAALSLGHRAVL